MSLDNTMAGSMSGNGTINAGVSVPRAATAVAQPLVGRLPWEMSLCLFLIFYLAAADWLLKFVPSEGAARLLRYLPEAILYLTALHSLWKTGKLTRAPFFWPLVFCALEMMFSAFKNGSPLSHMVKDFYLFYRWSGFALILWSCDFKMAHISRFINIYLRFVIFQLIVGFLELIGGNSVKVFFAPDWTRSGGDAISHAQTTPMGYITGILSHYNYYGSFVCIGMIFAMGMYRLYKHQKPGYQVLAWSSGIAAVLSFSRHTLISLVVALFLPLLLHARRGALQMLVKRSLIIGVLGSIICASSPVLRDSVQTRLDSLTRTAAVTKDIDENARLFMIVELTPLFLSTYPIWGQGPYEIPPGVSDPAESHMGPQLKAAPQLPGLFTYFILDVLWLDLLGAYGLAGIFCLLLVFSSVLVIALRVRKAGISPECTTLCELFMVTLPVLILTGLFGAEIVSRETAPIFWSLAGMIFSIGRRYGFEMGKKSSTMPLRRVA